jgi:hypothetical protein
MSLYDRDYMRQKPNDLPPDAPLEERVAGRLMAFLRRHPRLPYWAIAALVVLLVAAILAVLFQEG